MEYDVALTKAWQELELLTKEKRHSLPFLNDTYDIDAEKRSVSSLSCNIPAKPFLAILILHYLSQRVKGLAPVTGEWISFKELVGGEGYYPTFQKRVVGTIIRKYSENPDALFLVIERFKAKKAQLADVSVVLETFESVPILLTMWRADEEFGTEANVLFDKNITSILSTEDIVVLSEYVAHSI